jgi:hypothetical protein
MICFPNRVVRLIPRHTMNSSTGDSRYFYLSFLPNSIATQPNYRESCSPRKMIRTIVSILFSGFFFVFTNSPSEQWPRLTVPKSHTHPSPLNFRMPHTGAILPIDHDRRHIILLIVADLDPSSLERVDDSTGTARLLVAV